MKNSAMQPHPAATGIDSARNGVVLIDKPEGMTSHDTVREARRITGASKAGHSGTLDRFASGLLVLCTGRYTRLTQFLLEEDKVYTGIVRLGVTTDTDDREGAVIDERPAGSVRFEDILACAERLTGEFMQMPPRYSALKIRGRRASDRVRKGEEVTLRERRVIVHEFEVGDHDPGSARFAFRVSCSKGTYVRSLARDMGEMLGTGGHLESLRRIASGPFRVEDAATLGLLRECLAGYRGEMRFLVHPPDALGDFGRIMVGDAARALVMNGSPFPPGGVRHVEDRGGKRFIILDEGENLIAIAEMDIQKWHLRYINVFNPQSGGDGRGSETPASGIIQRQ
ncbi:MAG: tRNA pseudouridine(55) synthase TruB [Spirochaetes bacterium]|nr:tRNA pseudouridine(55) synthase TruB [Spirochaetota bacterium]